MSLEAANWISELSVTDPPGSDKKKQGDDHLRLIKTVLKASFPTASKAFYNPSTSAKTGDFTITAAMMNTTFVIDTTSAAIAATLPTLVSGDAGWECFFLKTNTGTNAFFITPASGTIQSGDISGLAKTRRCIPGVRTGVLWTGSVWIATRAVNAPVGTVLDCPRSSLPVGFEWPNGQTLSSASSNYPDFYSANGSSGVVVDRRGRLAAGKDDMGGSAASRITTAGSSVDGATLSAVGGAQNVTISQGNLPAASLTVTGNAIGNATVSGGSPIVVSSAAASNAQPFASGGPVPVYATDKFAALDQINIPLSGASAALGGSGTVLNKMPPVQVTNLILVVE